MLRLDQPDEWVSAQPVENVLGHCNVIELEGKREQWRDHSGRHIVRSGAEGHPRHQAGFGVGAKFLNGRASAVHAWVFVNEDNEDGLAVMLDMDIVRLSHAKMLVAT